MTFLIPLVCALKYNILHPVKDKRARTIDNRRELKIVLKLESFFDILSETVKTHLAAYINRCLKS